MLNLDKLQRLSIDICYLNQPVVLFEHILRWSPLTELELRIVTSTETPSIMVCTSEHQRAANSWLYSLKILAPSLTSLSLPDESFNSQLLQLLKCCTSLEYLSICRPNPGFLSTLTHPLKILRFATEEPSEQVFGYITYELVSEKSALRRLEELRLPCNGVKISEDSRRLLALLNLRNIKLLSTPEHFEENYGTPHAIQY